MEKNNIFNGKSGIAKFFNSYDFIWIIALLTFVFWFFNLDVEGLAVIFVIMTAILVFCEDATPVMTCFVFMFFIFSQDKMTLEGKELWAALLVLPLAGFVYNIIKFKTKGLTFGGFSISVFVVLIPWLLQGIGRQDRDTLRAVLCVAIAVAFVVVYVCIYITSRRDKKNYVEYIAHVFLAVGVLIVLDVLVFHLRIADYKFEVYNTRLGWGTRNPIAAILSMVMPVAFFYSTKKGKFNFLFILLGFAEYIVVLLLQSRGAALFATAAMPVLLVYCMICAQKRRANIITCAALLVGIVFVAVFQKEVTLKLFDRVLNQSLDDNGRQGLWAEGVKMFFEYPLFGAGFDYQNFGVYTIDTVGPLYYHSTFMQIYASLGVLGGVAYAYFYYWRYRVGFTDLDAGKCALLIGFVVFEGYCFVDTVYFQPVGYFLMLMVSMCMEKDLDSKQTETWLETGLKKLKRKKKEIAV